MNVLWSTIREYVRNYVFKGIEFVYFKCRLVDAKLDHTVFELDVTKDVLDRDGNLGRAVIATIMDSVMGMGYWEPYNRGIKFTGVTADMSFTLVQMFKN